MRTTVRSSFRRAHMAGMGPARGSRWSADSSRRLILVRHGESTYNARNLFTGRTDVNLTLRGEAEARETTGRLAALGIEIDAAFSSPLRRARHTAEIILSGQGAKGAAVGVSNALLERDYGALTGLDKDLARARWGDAQVQLWRRSFAIAPPGGESLRDLLARLLPYFVQTILPAVMRGQVVLVVGHGNTLRALTFVLDGLSPNDVSDVEYETGEALLYSLNRDTTVATKRSLSAINSVGSGRNGLAPEPESR